MARVSTPRPIRSTVAAAGIIVMSIRSATTSNAGTMSPPSDVTRAVTVKCADPNSAASWKTTGSAASTPTAARDATPTQAPGPQSSGPGLPASESACASSPIAVRSPSSSTGW